MSSFVDTPASPVLTRGHWAALLLLLTACGPGIDRLQVDPTPRAPQPVSSIQVLLDEPDRPYRSIALVEARGEDASLKSLTRSLAREAARLGGDAVVVSGAAGKKGLLARVIVFTK